MHLGNFRVLIYVSILLFCTDSSHLKVVPTIISSANGITPTESTIFGIDAKEQISRTMYERLVTSNVT